MAGVVIDYIKLVDAIAKQFEIVYKELIEDAETKKQAMNAAVALAKLPDATDEQKQAAVEAVEVFEAADLIYQQLINIGDIEVSDEQSFDKKQNKNVKTLFIVVKFGVGTSNFASSVSPISVMCVGTANKVKPAQILLSAFAARWTTLNILQDIEDEEQQSLEISDVLQVWNTPEVVSNFNEVNSEFRNLFRLIGTLVIGPKAVRLGTLTYVYDEEAFNLNRENGCEKINIMSFEEDYMNSLDPQPFGHTHGFATSEVNFATYAFSVSTYSLNTQLNADIRAMKGFRKRNSNSVAPYSNAAPDKDFILILEFTDGYTNYPAIGEQTSSSDEILGDKSLSVFKLVNAKTRQELGDLASLVISFSR